MIPTRSNSEELGQLDPENRKENQTSIWFSFPFCLVLNDLESSNSHKHQKKCIPYDIRGIPSSLNQGRSDWAYRKMNSQNEEY